MIRMLYVSSEMKVKVTLSEIMATSRTCEFEESLTGTVFDCPICLERLTVPKYLPCLHTFCKQCIESYLEKFVQHLGTSTYFECPVCRQKVIAPEANITSVDWANKLPINHLLLSLESGTRTHNIADCESVLCKPCQRVHERRRAKFYCSNCDDNLCETCFTYLHKRIPHYENHKISKISEPNLTLDVGRCLIHKNSVLEVYCFDHEELGCNECSNILHQGCTNVKSVDEVAEHFDTETIDSAVARMKIKTETEIQKTKLNSKQLEDQSKQIHLCVLNLVDDIKKRLDVLQDSFLKEFEVTHEHEKSCLSSTQGCLEGFSKTLTRYEEMLRLTKTRSKKQLFLTALRIKPQLLEELNDFRKWSKCQGHTEYQWEENSRWKDITEADNIVNVQVKKSERNFIPDLKREEDSFNRYVKDFQTKKMKSYQLIPVNDHIFAHTDNPWCIKVIQKNGVITKTLKGSNCGFGYFALSRNGRRIVYSTSNSVICEEIDGEEVFHCSEKQTGLTRKGARGIGVDFHDNIYICDSKGGSVVKISASGEQAKIIMPSLCHIKKPYALSFDKSGKRFFVGSWLETHGMIEVYELQ
ncbi:transcription intermediary factor 1-beta-like [Ostrea edulis]|uniref:transcription intermediary factor 1-beta-like n=1 Tax=Ostrea edulis TaxID=37623 RepID=UPI0024AEF9EC|nr:transcription intermediary factor 1-beta-like [Ostrea edulis]